METFFFLLFSFLQSYNFSCLYCVSGNWLVWFVRKHMNVPQRLSVGMSLESQMLLSIIEMTGV